MLLVLPADLTHPVPLPARACLLALWLRQVLLVLCPLWVLLVLVLQCFQLVLGRRWSRWPLALRLALQAQMLPGLLQDPRALRPREPPGRPEGQRTLLHRLVL